MSFWQNFKNKKFIKDNEKLLADVKGVKLHGLSDNALNNLYLSYKNSDYELVNAISCIIEIIKRRTGIVLHDNQVLSALVMSNGKIAEMATGEGKTLSAIVTAMLLHLSGRKIHIFTANDYLVERDFKYAENIFSGLGINVGYIHKSLSLEDKKQFINLMLFIPLQKNAVLIF
jgi:Preprotein translocase subunit SecA (ATPase, RNA helicase)